MERDPDLGGRACACLALMIWSNSTDFANLRSAKARPLYMHFRHLSMYIRSKSDFCFACRLLSISARRQLTPNPA
ncbi:hypothetical protein FIBSPDRAFT_878582 [Athelia psychrophila]|uniref:Uncharacterized protein n=1 Tax=Athelia psychrophila TaxID=1759441 RepID=A0A167UWI0_9AGAM|nr:hypothetical protein FIBSPDRAFT_878582 [Fibularhizoctonia sp. CBS 109695]